MDDFKKICKHKNSPIFAYFFKKKKKKKQVFFLIS